MLELPNFQRVLPKIVIQSREHVSFHDIPYPLFTVTVVIPRTRSTFYNPPFYHHHHRHYSVTTPPPPPLLKIVNNTPKRALFNEKWNNKTLTAIYLKTGLL